MGVWVSQRSHAKEGKTINPKIQRIDRELEKNREKIADLQAKNRELERQKTELENAEIIALVRGIQGTRGTPEDLGTLLEALRGGVPAAQSHPQIEPPQPVPRQDGYADANQTNKEDDHED